MTWGTAGAAEPRKLVGADGGAGAGGIPSLCGFPQREHVSTVAGFMLPQNGQRVYRMVPCSLESSVIFYAHLDWGRLYLPVALIQMGLV